MSDCDELCSAWGAIGVLLNRLNQINKLTNNVFCHFGDMIQFHDIYLPLLWSYIFRLAKISELWAFFFLF